MADLTVLIRLHRHALDEKRRVLGEFYRALAELERKKRDLDLALEQEKENIARSGDVHFTFASYAAAVKRKRAEIERQEAEVERQVEQAKESLMETFSELKKYEMTQDERERLEEEERRVKESRIMDEIGLEGFRRKGEE